MSSLTRESNDSSAFNYDEIFSSRTWRYFIVKCPTVFYHVMTGFLCSVRLRVSWIFSHEVTWKEVTCKPLSLENHHQKILSLPINSQLVRGSPEFLIRVSPPFLVCVKAGIVKIKKQEREKNILFTDVIWSSWNRLKVGTLEFFSLIFKIKYGQTAPSCVKTASCYKKKKRPSKIELFWSLCLLFCVESLNSCGG